MDVRMRQASARRWPTVCSSSLPLRPRRAASIPCVRRREPAAAVADMRVRAAVELGRDGELRKSRRLPSASARPPANLALPAGQEPSTRTSSADRRLLQLWRTPAASPTRDAAAASTPTSGVPPCAPPPPHSPASRRRRPTPASLAGHGRCPRLLAFDSGVVGLPLARRLSATSTTLRATAPRHMTRRQEPRRHRSQGHATPASCSPTPPSARKDDNPKLCDTVRLELPQPVLTPVLVRGIVRGSASQQAGKTGGLFSPREHLQHSGSVCVRR